MEPEEDLQIDMGAAQAAMDADFSLDESGGGEAGTAGGESPPQPGVAPLAPAPLVGQPPAPAPVEPWRAPPKSWKGDLHPLYQKLEPPVMQYIHEREKQALDGLMQYKTALDPYLNLQKQYKPWLDHYKVDMPSVVDRMIKAHLALQYAEPEVKQQYFAQLVQEYGLEEMVKAVAAGNPGQANGAQPDLSKVVLPMLQRYLGPIQQNLRQIQAREDAKGLETSQAEVDKFFADPQNEYARELESDMVQLLQAGVAANLSEAYEKAIWHNPAVRAKAMQKEIDKVTKAKPGPRNVRSGSTPPASTKPPGDEDMDATMRETFRAINNR